MPRPLPLLAALLGLPLLALLTAILTRPFTTAAAAHLLTQEAATAGAVALLLIGAIRGAEYLVLHNFTLLWRLFTPLLWLTLATALLLIPLHATLLLHSMMAILAFFKTIRSALLVMVMGFLVIGLALHLFGTIGAAIHLSWALLKTFRRERFSLAGAMATAEARNPLRDVVESVATRLGHTPPDQIILLLEPDLFVTEVPIWIGDKRLTGRTLALSLSAMHLLTEAELSAVIAHEMAHLGARDTALLHRYAPILRRSEQIYRSLAVASHRGVIRSLGLLPAMQLLRQFHTSFTRACSSESRTREYAADAAALTIVPATVMGAALVKLHAASETWDETILRFAKNALPVENGARLFTVLARQTATPERIAGLTSKTMAHPFDTHPSLYERLAALDLTLEAVTPGLDLEPRDASIALVPDAEEIEEFLTRGIRDWMSRTWNDNWWRYRR